MPNIETQSQMTIDWTKDIPACSRCTREEETCEYPLSVPCTRCATRGEACDAGLVTKLAMEERVQAQLNDALRTIGAMHKLIHSTHTIHKHMRNITKTMHKFTSGQKKAKKRALKDLVTIQKLQRELRAREVALEHTHCHLNTLEDALDRVYASERVRY
ncbi:hypothetical protein CYLTODRAFT_459595 [Cylindrobasidium torrendii FP15055 ss-10]|uniref:Zn(2)-C6 fungal-type domain-containing protein n=1 Tax=Cylindrobasidium torrendii FP15055 ss-10 TaxID=1314674 RepID=A0A0D7AWV8_9AGAR|nr:hypothetical protein CYLTODRAFT_459595 [Cylindrobasidium torrendii FP15055 ss-10]